MQSGHFHISPRSEPRAQPGPAIHLYQICDEIVSLFLPSAGSWPPPRQRWVKSMKFRNIWQPPIAKRFKLESCFYLTLTGLSPSTQEIVLLHLINILLQSKHYFYIRYLWKLYKNITVTKAGFLDRRCWCVHVSMLLVTSSPQQCDTTQTRSLTKFLLSSLRLKVVPTSV